MEKIDPRKLSVDARQQLRYQVIRLRRKGRKHGEISAITGVGRCTCSTWTLYKKEGEKALKIKKRDRSFGNCRTMTPEQEKAIQKSIYAKCPDQMKLTFALWTRTAVQQLIKQQRSSDRPIRTVGEYLKRRGGTPQKPLGRAYRQAPKAVTAWFNREYPEIRKRAQKDTAEIHWGDETGLCNDSCHGGRYAPRGQTPAIEFHPRCDRVNLMSSVTNQGKVRFMVYKEQMNSQTLIKFMNHLIKDAPEKVFLILDDLKVHHSYVVRDWVKAHQDEIELFFLPSYLSGLNPDEYLNCDLQAGVLSGVPARSKKQLTRKTISNLRKLQKLPNRVMKYFRPPKISYAC